PAPIRKRVAIQKTAALKEASHASPARRIRSRAPRVDLRFDAWHFAAGLRANIQVRRQGRVAAVPEFPMPIRLDRLGALESRDGENRCNENESEARRCEPV